jgi:hypothetical protein
MNMVFIGQPCWEKLDPTLGQARNEWRGYGARTEGKLFGAWSLEVEERPRAWDELPNQTHQETGVHADPEGRHWQGLAMAANQLDLTLESF